MYGRKSVEVCNGFSGISLFTSSGLPFTYTLKKGRDGTYTKELFIDRRTWDGN